MRPLKMKLSDPLRRDFRLAARVMSILAVIAVALPGCSGGREPVCSDDQYPVWSVKFPETGGACVPDGEEPMRGYATYPPGLVPEYVSDITRCQDGKCTEGPLAIKCPPNYPKDPCLIAGQTLPTDPGGD